MTEPLTDEEQKKETMFLDWVKNNWKTEYGKGDNFKRLWKFADRLIATVESLKKMVRSSDTKCDELIEQNAKLKIGLDAALTRIQEIE